MPDPQGEHLLVQTSASQARRRLKGFGHGVRKVQSAGHQRALIIHTATGQHLRELESLFSDVGFTQGASDAAQGESLDADHNHHQPRAQH
jgi:hypothetical protein